MKFDVWNKKKKKWEQSLDYMLDSFGMLYCDGGLTYGCIPVFYTGIKDSEGTEIREGDIIRLEFGTGNGGKSTKYKYFNCVVEFCDGRFEHKWPRDYGKYRFSPHCSEGKIIGNKYEHPELLEQE
jgi:hypothetical protein